MTKPFTKPFASHGDMSEKKTLLTPLSRHAYAYEVESDPTSGVIVGDDGVAVVDARATPVEAQTLIAKVKAVTDKPIKYVILTHYHAVRVLGASAYGAEHIVCSEATLEMIRERGEADFQSEVGRFPRLFRAVDSVPGLTFPTMTFSQRMTLWLGELEVRIEHIGRGHTRGDSIVYLPQDNVLFSGDLVENRVSVYAGDGHIAEWLQTLEKVRAYKPAILVPGRGPALKGEIEVNAAIDATSSFLSALYFSVRLAVSQGATLKQTYDATRQVMDPRFGHWPVYEHCIPFVVSRAFDEVHGIDQPVVWTAERDRDIWAQLQGQA